MPPYVESWRDYRGRVRLVYATGLGGFVIMILLMLLASVLIQGLGLSALRQAVSVLFYAFGFAWLAACAISWVRLGSWQCPRCSNLFFSRGLGSNQLARRCLHCGLPKWAEDAAGSR
jgi:hypothetical protein